MGFFKNVVNNAMKYGIPAVFGGALAGGIHSAADTYGDKVFPADGSGDWFKPLVPGVVGTFLYGSKKDSVRHGASAMIGYSIGTVTKPKADEMLGAEVLADEDFNEFTS